MSWGSQHNVIILVGLNGPALPDDPGVAAGCPLAALNPIWVQRGNGFPS